MFISLRDSVELVFARVYVTERAHLTDSQLIRAALDGTELVEHDDTVFSFCRWRILHAEQGFVPVRSHTKHDNTDVNSGVNANDNRLGKAY